MGCYVTVIILMLGLSFNSCSRFPPRVYYYIDLAMTWSDAQQYCRESYTDLATFENMDDINMLQPDISYSWAWIGLRDDPASWKEALGTDKNSWRWSATGETSQTGYHNWYGVPDYWQAVEVCIQMVSGGSWNDAHCGNLYSFVCYDVTNQNETTYVLISEIKSWTAAQAYCREHYTDLPTIESVEENNAVRSAMQQSSVIWIGLYRVPWAWSDESQSSFRNFRIYSPDNYNSIEHCMAENIWHEWDDAYCDAMLPFICHQVTNLETTVKMTMKTDADLTDPTINDQILQQLGALLTSQGWTDFKLQWKTQPRKVEEEKPADTECTLHF